MAALSTMAMVACPALFSAIGFSERETGDTATIVKLFRVALLVPFAFILPMTMAGFTSAVLPGFSIALVWSRP